MTVDVDEDLPCEQMAAELKSVRAVQAARVVSGRRRIDRIADVVLDVLTRAGGWKM